MSKASKNGGDAGGFRCPLCGRDGVTASRHHLIPKSCDGRVTAHICTDCHRQVHALFTLRQLERELDTLDRLREAAPMRRWIAWAARQGAGKVSVRNSHAKHRRHDPLDFTQDFTQDFTDDLIS
jgi:5-methylcytosine-specific restriction protein A